MLGLNSHGGASEVVRRPCSYLCHDCHQAPPTGHKYRKRSAASLQPFVQHVKLSWEPALISTRMGSPLRSSPMTLTRALVSSLMYCTCFPDFPMMAPTMPNEGSQSLTLSSCVNSSFGSLPS